MGDCLLCRLLALAVDLRRAGGAAVCFALPAALLIAWAVRLAVRWPRGD